MGCALPTAFYGLARDFWNISNMVIVFLVIFVYSVTYRKLQVSCRHPASNRTAPSYQVKVCMARNGNKCSHVVVYKSIPENQEGKKISNDSSQSSITCRNGRLMKSLLVVVIVYVFTWAATMITIFTVPLFNVSESVIFHTTIYVGILANINVGCNFYIYYFRSHDYRTAFNSCFRPLSSFVERPMWK